MEKEVYYTISDKNKMVEVVKENIQTIRFLYNGCSIRKFAKICNVCPQTVSNWENKNTFKYRNYWPTVLSLLLNKEMNPLDDDKSVKLILYILFGYHDPNYKENIEKIRIIAQAYKGGANQQSIEMLYSALQLDPNACLILSEDPTMQDFIRDMIQEQFN